jgi:hypothetical protein
VRSKSCAAKYLQRTDCAGSVTRMISRQWHCSCATNAHATSKALPSRSTAARHPGFISTAEASGRNDTSSFRLDVRLVNDAAEVIILDAKKSGEIGAARDRWIHFLGDKFRLDLRRLYCRSEPAGELGSRFLRHFRRGHEP